MATSNGSEVRLTVIQDVRQNLAVMSISEALFVFVFKSAGSTEWQAVETSSRIKRHFANRVLSPRKLTQVLIQQRVNILK